METLPLTAILSVGLALAGILVIGFPLRAVLARVHVPTVVTLLSLGVLLGPHGLDLMPGAYLDIRNDLSKAALVVILLRAGMGVPPRILRVILVPSLIFGFVPVAAECLVLTAMTRGLVFESWRVALLAGFMIAAVSPAVVIPAMQAQKDAGLGAATVLGSWG